MTIFAYSKHVLSHGTRVVLAVSMLAGLSACRKKLADTVKPKASCSDGAWNGDEADVDCGGSCAQKCGTGSKCAASTDCADGTCTNSECIAAPAVVDKPIRELVECKCAVALADADGDCEPDSVEDTNGNGVYDVGVDFSDLKKADTDGDGIPDGCEDWNHDGKVDTGPNAELNPTRDDTDGDLIKDGVEDGNHNGRFDPEGTDKRETDGTDKDTDHDGFSDGDEDRNHDGLTNCPEKADVICETNPRKSDSDDDGLSDATELRSRTDPHFYSAAANADENCNGFINDPLRFKGKDQQTGQNRGDPKNYSLDDQTCPWKADSDDDGLADGLEDRDADGGVSSGETNPRLQDSDSDGLADGYEDTNRDGLYNPVTETDPTRFDTDQDGLSDGLEDSGGCLTGFDGLCQNMAVNPLLPACDCNNWHAGGFNANESDPKVPDTDGDGLRDGVEDQNHDGVCQLAVIRAAPSPNDETCAYMQDSDGDRLDDGDEDLNHDGNLDVGEFDPRRADADSDCLIDVDEKFLGTDPTKRDTDGDGLPDGLEDSKHLLLDNNNNCVPLSCAPTYFVGQCVALDPLQRDSDGDGRSDGPEIISEQPVGEDLNANGCVDQNETDPCNPSDVPAPPAVGGVERTCVVEGGCSPTATPLLACRPASPASQPSQPIDDCKNAYNQALAFACSEGNVRPLTVVRNEGNDYALALPAVKKRPPGKLLLEVHPLFGISELKYKSTSVGHGFQSIDAESGSGAEAVRSVFGAILRLATIRPGTGGGCDQVVDGAPFIENPPSNGSLPPLPTGTCAPTTHLIVPNASLSVTNVAQAAGERIEDELKAAGYTIEHTAGAPFNAHDDDSANPLPSAIKVTASTDRFVLKRTTGDLDPVVVKAIVMAAIAGRNALIGDVKPPASKGDYTQGPIIDLRVEYYRREVRSRIFKPDGSSELVPIVQYGAIFALAPLTSDCGDKFGLQRARCRLAAEAGTAAVADITNGSSLARYSATIGTQCEPFDPKPALADFLLVIDDSVSMQDYIRAISRAATDVAFRLRANSENLDWRIGMTTSNLGREDGDAPLAGRRDTFEPDYATNGYPKRSANLNDSTSGPAISYQSTAFNSSGVPVRCHYSESYDPNDPTGSPYCCEGGGAIANDDEYFRACCAYQGGAGPTLGVGGVRNHFTDVDLTDGSPLKSGTTLPRYHGDDTFRCWDFPRYSQFNQGYQPYVGSYPPYPDEQKRNYLDWLCANQENHSYRLVYGTDGYLWPPGLRGPNPDVRLDGANLLIRNADQLILQMNRPCAFGDFTARSAAGSAQEAPLQALKRAVQRATAIGRTDEANKTPYKLRKGAPLFAIILSDEEDYAFKYKNSSAPAAAQARDVNALPPAACVNNGDNGCTLSYCAGLYPGLVNVTNQYDNRIPAGNNFKRTATGASNTYDMQAGTQCITPFVWNPAGTPITDLTVPASRRYDGYAEVAAGVDENAATLEGDPPSAAEISQPNNVPRDVINPNNANPISCGDGTGLDCLPCVRFLRTRQYVDFFSGKCSPPTQVIDDKETRRYPAPVLEQNGTTIPLPLGGVYAVTRRPKLQGGSEGACGANYPGGDGQAYRDVALASGGKVADICAATRPTGFADFLDEIIVDAQGVASPYRLRGKPISSTIRVAVLGLNGELRVLRRSSVSGFDYNASANALAFFTIGLTGSETDPDAKADAAAKISVRDDYKVFVSYRVWGELCPEACAVNDACGVCACSAASPWCCTPQPTFECRPTTPCLLGCGQCQKCDPVSNKCRDNDPCNNNCGSGSQCNYQTGKCDTCPAGTVSVSLPCGEGCTTPTRFVCVSQAGVPKLGLNCTGNDTGNDCCGADQPCPGDTVCVLQRCGGESCIPTATCQSITTNLCNMSCPDGTQCAPRPCATEACPAIFECQAKSPPPLCALPTVCSGSGPSPDCALCQQCFGGQCASLLPPAASPNTSVLECCTTPGINCCPAGEIFNAITLSCSAVVDCVPKCAADQSCVNIAGKPTCVSKGT